MKTNIILALVALLAASLLCYRLVTSSDWYIQRRFDRAYPEWAGADPTGRRDSTAVFQRNVRKAFESGSAVRFPPGNFQICGEVPRYADGYFGPSR